MAAGKSAVLSVRIIADAAKAAAGFKDAERQVETFESKVTSKLGMSREQIDKVAVASTAAATAYGAFAVDAMKSASELEQATGAVNAVFKDQADDVMKMAEGAAKAVGLSAAEYANSSAIMASQLGNMGVAQDEVAGQTDELIRLAADLASMYGGTTAEAIDSVSSLLRGERDPIEKYAVSIKQADINARLAAEGLTGLEGEAAKQAETQATLALLFEQSADAQGNFARESDTAAGATQIARAEWENAKATLGEQFLPVAVQAAEWLSNIAGIVGEHPQLFMAAGVAIGGFASAAVGISTAMRAVEGFSAAFKVLNTVVKANPIGAAVAAAVALGGALVTAYQESETFRNFVDEFGRTALQVFSDTGRWIDEKVIQPLQDAIDKIREFFDWVGSGWDSVKSFGSNLLPFGAADPEITGRLAADVMRFYPTPPDVTAAYSFGATPTGGPAWPVRTSPIERAPAPIINIEINGVLDADDAAREIRRLLERDEMRQSW